MRNKQFNVRLNDSEKEQQQRVKNAGALFRWAIFKTDLIDLLRRLEKKSELTVNDYKQIKKKLHG
jgi:hypothetical protein